MDAMKDALKKKMLEMKGGPMMADSDADPAKEGSDLAPAIKGEEGEELMAVEGEQPAIDPELLAQIIAALSDHDPGAGRAPMGLQERAAVGAKEKLAGLKK